MGLFRAAAFASITALVGVIACGGGTTANNVTGTGEETLVKQTNGEPTGDGTTCSWAGTSLYAELRIAAPTYQVDATFGSLDGCNACSCTSQGIACTSNTCGTEAGAPPPQGCTAEAMICPDGTPVGRTGANCELTPCPTGGNKLDGGRPHACSDIAKRCPDGSIVSPSGPNCEIPACP